MAVRLKYGQLAPEGLARMTEWEHHLNTGTGLEPSLRGYVRLLASMMNGCQFCIKMHTAELRKLNEPEEKIAGLKAWASSGLFTARERAALGWTEAVTNIQDGHAPNAVYEALRVEFGEVEVVNLTMVITAINGWNRIAIALGNHAS